MMPIDSKPQGRFPFLPHAVETTLEELGRNLKTARLRRNIPVQEVADRLGITRLAITRAEKGKASTGIAVYAGLLWTYGMLDQLAALAEPARDAEGMALSERRERASTKRAARISDEF
jgi:transcriptional regulator with XRE-family HTH domain